MGKHESKRAADRRRGLRASVAVAPVAITLAFAGVSTAAPVQPGVSPPDQPGTTTAPAPPEPQSDTGLASFIPDPPAAPAPRQKPQYLQPQYEQPQYTPAPQYSEQSPAPQSPQPRGPKPSAPQQESAPVPAAPIGPPAPIAPPKDKVRVGSFEADRPEWLPADVARKGNAWSAWFEYQIALAGDQVGLSREDSDRIAAATTAGAAAGGTVGALTTGVPAAVLGATGGAVIGGVAGGIIGATVGAPAGAVLIPGVGAVPGTFVGGAGGAAIGAGVGAAAGAAAVGIPAAVAGGAVGAVAGGALGAALGNGDGSKPVPAPPPLLDLPAPAPAPEPAPAPVQVPEVAIPTQVVESTKSAVQQVEQSSPAGAQVVATAREAVADIPAPQPGQFGAATDAVTSVLGAVQAAVGR